jgi:hypothetical protein
MGSWAGIFLYWNQYFPSGTHLSLRLQSLYFISFLVILTSTLSPQYDPLEFIKFHCAGPHFSYFYCSVKEIDFTLSQQQWMLEFRPFKPGHC